MVPTSKRSRNSWPSTSKTSYFETDWHLKSYTIRYSETLDKLNSQQSNIWVRWYTNGYACKTRKIFNTCLASTRDTRAVDISGRNYVRESRQNKRTVTSVQILNHLCSSGIISVTTNPSGDDDRKDKKAALRSVQRYLKRRGFGTYSYWNSSDLIYGLVVAEYVQYLRTIFVNRAHPPQQRLREVYLYESHLHHHCHRFIESLYDPNDEHDLQVRLQHKGRTYYIVYDIQSIYPINEQEYHAGFVKNSLRTFWAHWGLSQSIQKVKFRSLVPRPTIA